MNKLMIMAVIMLVLSVSAHASYFNTDRPQKIIGVFVTEREHIDEIEAFSNAFGFAPNSVNEITHYLDANQRKLLSVISISKLLFDDDSGMYHHNVSAIIDAIEKSRVNNPEILFLMDEPLWWVRNACNEFGKPQACQDVANRYVETLSTMRTVGQLLRKQFPGSGVMHIEAWAELVQQKQAFPHEHVIMLDDAEYLGFNCYGNFDYCGSLKYGYNSQVEYGTWVWETMQAFEATNPIGRKLYLVPGSFLAVEHFDSVQAILDQMAMYTYVVDLHEKIAGLGVFLWGDMVESNKPFIGARNIPSVVNFLVFISKIFGIENKNE